MESVVNDDQSTNGKRSDSESISTHANPENEGPASQINVKRTPVSANKGTETEKNDPIGSAKRILAKVWGFDEFRPLQEEAVVDVIQGRDSVVVLPTGGGKSLCYQVPALVREGMAVVVSPLISLMKDQVDGLVSNGVSAALVNSTQSDEQKRETAARIRRGEIDLLYLAPERLLTNRTLDFLATIPISFFAIDEAHCVSNWGHDFRPEYRGLRILKQRFPGASVHAFTATASQRVRDDIAEQLDLVSPSILVGNFDRPNLTYRMIRRANALLQIMSVIDQHRGESGVVYCITRKEVEQTAAALSAEGISALPYHAGLDDATRQQNQDAFIREQVNVIVATVAFGMGIDKSNVRFVIHAGMPKSIEHYQQESGRAGRDGLASQCVLLYSGGDLMTWKRILELGDPSNVDEAMQNVRAMADLCTGVQCRHAAIVNYFGQEFDADNCNACDVCLGELNLVDDPLTLSQKILSCVIRLKERYGVSYTVKVLTGSRDAKILEAGHDQLSTYGLLGEHSVAAVRTWIDQLISQGFLERYGEYNVLRMTDSGRELLKRKGTVTLTQPAKSSGGRSARSSSTDSWEGVDRGLFDRLRSIRSDLASQRKVPAYVIFGDAVLRDLARCRPSTLEKLSNVKGIGERKLADFGEVFLEEINAYCGEHGLSRDETIVVRSSSAVSGPPKPKSLKGTATEKEAFGLFSQGKSVAEVAKRMDRATSTVSGYLIRYIEDATVTNAAAWVAPEKIPVIESAVGASEDGRLKPIYEAIAADGSVQDDVSYEEIRIVIACHRNRKASTA
ncbi:MAG: DNA helicase RecQ [Rhodopirellula sp. JB044]|uniref:DNA helicase RecQ n=1 Tax=Rhodopirellula sp. JB044 TaxID=3342844 RepID=UPI00370A09D9